MQSFYTPFRVLVTKYRINMIKEMLGLAFKLFVESFLVVWVLGLVIGSFIGYT